ncbi:MAG TPA: DUF1592 domain-containing protein, partial [Polyangia bacterium]
RAVTPFVVTEDVGVRGSGVGTATRRWRPSMAHANAQAGLKGLCALLVLAGACTGAVSDGRGNGTPSEPGTSSGNGSQPNNNGSNTGSGNGGNGQAGGNNGGAGSNGGTGNNVAADIGFSPAGRLNRTQYNNTVRDLLGTSLTPADAFPADENTLGFDTISGALRVQPEHLEKYLAATTSLIDEFFTRPASDPIRARYLTCDIATGGAACHLKVLKAFATKAWRRPVEDAELAPYATLVAAQPTPQEGVAAGLRAVLMSTKFLYRLELDSNPEDPKPRRLNGYELASRLSYFLWGTMPDDELFANAASGMLTTDAGLQAQVKRMLGDKARSRALVESFGTQWLSISHMQQVTPDATMFPMFNNTIRAAMINESKEFIADFIASDRPITELFGAPFTYVNGALAAFYGISGVQGEAAQRVATTGTKRNGGLLTLGSYLVGESNPTRTSPVKRGLFILDRLLCSPLPPPPPGTDVNIDQGSGLENLSVRQRLEMHQAKGGTCAACHRLIDGIGIGLENFDAVGRYRDRDEFGPIDANAELPAPSGAGMVKFNGADELAKVLAMDPRTLPCVVDKVLTFGLGRSFETDTKLRDEIAGAVKNKGGSLRAAIETVIAADVFRSRRAASMAEVKQ